MQKTWVRILTTGMTLGIMLMIFLFSAQNGDQSGSVSGTITGQVIRLLRNDYDALPPAEQKAYYDRVDLVIRKTGHFTEFAALGFWLRLCLESWAGKRRWLFPAAWLGGTAWAALDEVHQLFVDSRAGQVRDVAIDSAGVLCGVLIAQGLLALIRKRRRAAA